MEENKNNLNGPQKKNNNNNKKYLIIIFKKEGLFLDFYCQLFEFNYIKN